MQSVRGTPGGGLCLSLSWCVGWRGEGRRGPDHEIYGLKVQPAPYHKNLNSAKKNSFNSLSRPVVIPGPGGGRSSERFGRVVKGTVQIEKNLEMIARKVN